MYVKIFYALLLKILLDFFYPISVKNFSYLWHTNLIIDFQRIVFGYVLLILLSFVIYKKNNKIISQIIVEILFSIIVIPIICQWTYNNENTRYLFMVILSFLILNLIIKFRIRKLVIKLKKIQIREKKIQIPLLFITISIIVIALQKNAIDINSFNLNKVYEIREKNQTNFFLDYAIPFQCYFILPYLIFNGLKNNEKLTILLGVITQMIIYSIFPHKIYLFIIVLCFALFFTKNKVKAMLKGSCLILVGGLFLKEKMLYALIDRLFLVPAMLNFQYFNFFQKNRFNYFSGSKLSFIFEQSKDQLELSQRLAIELYNGKMNPNTGFIASIYGEIGFIGIIIFTILLGITLRILDFIIEEDEREIATNILILVFFNLLNGQFISIFLTNGLAFIILFYSFFKIKKGD